MRLWTIQSEAAWNELNEHGELRGSIAYADRDFLPAYEWIAAQMAARIRPPDDGSSLPIWGWQQCDGKRRRPDLRQSAHLPRGTRGVRIEIDISDDEVLLSDFELWHYVLNYWYLPGSECDAERFESTHGREVHSWRKPPTNPVVDRLIRASWERIFDLEWFEQDIAVPRADKSIQAAFWRLECGHVVRADSFTAR